MSTEPVKVVGSRVGGSVGDGSMKTWDDITSPAPSHDVMYHNNKEKLRCSASYGLIISVSNSRRVGRKGQEQGIITSPRQRWVPSGE